MMGFGYWLRELLSDFTWQRHQACDYDDYLRRKVETARASMRAGCGRLNDEVKATFAARRTQSFRKS